MPARHKHVTYRPSNSSRENFNHFVIFSLVIAGYTNNAVHEDRQRQLSFVSSQVAVYVSMVEHSCWQLAHYTILNANPDTQYLTGDP
jgi:hypothetical protein